MKLRIVASDLLSKQILELKGDELVYTDATALTNRRKFKVDRVECVLMSAEGMLAFQVGNEVLSIQTKPDKPAHQALVDELVARLQATGGEAE